MIGRRMQIMALTALAMTITYGAFGYATNNFAEGVNFVTDPSPNTAASHINDYIYQDEQVNINPDSGIVRVLRTDQKALVNDFVTEFIPLKNAVARELRGLARTICRKEGGDADVARLKKDPKQFNGIVVVCPSFQLPYIRKTLEALDHDWVGEQNTGSWIYYYKAKHRDVQTMERITQFYATPDRVDDIDFANNAVVVSEQPCATELVKLGFREADIPPSILTLDVAIYEIDAQNDLGFGFDYESWKNGPGRALFEMVFWDFGGAQKEQIFPGAVPLHGEGWGQAYSHNLTITTAYLDFLQTRGKGKLRTKATLVAKSGTTARVAAVDDVVAFNVKGSSRQSQTVQAGRTLQLTSVYEFYYDRGLVHPSLNSLLFQQGTAQMTPAQVVASLTAFMTNVAKLDAPVVAKAQAELTAKAADGELTRAEVHSTLVATNSSIATYQDRSLKYEKVDQVGMTLTVTPAVALESCELALTIDLTEVTGLTPSGGPIIDRRAIASQFEVRNGQPIVMSGIKKNRKATNKNGIPYLSDIWGLGFLFGRKVSTKHETEMVVILTPKFSTHSMKDTEPAAEVAIAKQLAEDKYKLEIPWTSFGFDQWLLDCEARLKF